MYLLLQVLEIILAQQTQQGILVAYLRSRLVSLEAATLGLEVVDARAEDAGELDALAFVVLLILC